MANRIKAKEADQGKRLSTHSSEDPDKLPPKFCLRGMRPKYSLTNCTKEEKSAFADRLFELSRNSWAALRQMPRHGQGWETIARDSIKGDGVPVTVTEDANIIAFRCIGKAPMVGYRSRDGVFNILWIDRDFTLYDHS
jgi:hypothetical protein